MDTSGRGGHVTGSWLLVLHGRFFYMDEGQVRADSSCYGLDFNMVGPSPLPRFPQVRTGGGGRGENSAALKRYFLGMCVCETCVIAR